MSSTSPQRRRYPRIPSAHAVLVRPLEGPTDEELARTSVMGLGGCRVTLSRPVAEDALVEVLISVDRDVVRAIARTAWCRQRDEGTVDLGLEFLVLDEGDRRRIRTLVEPAAGEAAAGFAPGTDDGDSEVERWVSGRCLCAGLAFEVGLPSRWCSHCHCELCRRAHGAPFVTWFGVDRARFRITDEAELLTWHRSSAEARRGFCSRCGSTLFFESTRWPDEVHVALAHMDGPIDRTPGAHVYFDRRVSWFDPADDLGKLGGATGTEPLG